MCAGSEVSILHGADCLNCTLAVHLAAQGTHALLKINSIEKKHDQSMLLIVIFRTSSILSQVLYILTYYCPQ